MNTWTDVKDGIYEFDPVIYPMRLWVGKKVDFDKAEEQFDFLDENGDVVENGKEQIRPKSSIIAHVTLVAHKESKWLGCLVNINKPKEVSFGAVAHEATHVTDWLREQFGVEGYSFLGGEARAYFTQWTADCIEIILKRK